MADLTLKQAIAGYYFLSSTAQDVLELLAERKVYRKGDLIAETGKFNASEYVVLSGICRTCIYSPDGQDNTLSFFVPGAVLSPYVIRVRDSVSMLNIQASTELELVSFDAKRFEQLIVDNLEIREFANTVLKRELAHMFQKEIGLASHTAKQRLINLRAQHPMLENLVPHAEIASYLGVTTISLSRLRKELMSSGNS